MSRAAAALLHERCSQAAAQRPDAPAVVAGAEVLTYGQLERESNQLARMLYEVGARRGDRVALVQAKSPGAIVSMLAALKAGCAYVPVDTEAPPARLRRVLDAAEPQVILTSEQMADLCRELAPAGVVGSVLGEVAGAAFGPQQLGEMDPAPLAAAPGELAHLLFTSGSTGAPKGVMVNHGMVCAFLDWAIEHFGIDHSDRLSSHPPLHFDLSTFDVFGALTTGAQLHLSPPGLVLPRQLVAYIRGSELTQWFSVPSAFAYIAHGNALADDGLPALRRLIWCGEVMPPAVLNHWMSRVAQASYTNLYGPTETAIASSYHDIATRPVDVARAIPIGTACAGETIEVLDGDCQQMPVGEHGELHISGVGVSPGYWHDRAASHAAFRQDPVSGLRTFRTGDLGWRDREGILHFVGRADTQIKSRGYRIELGEIELALGAVPGVAECAVVGLPTEGFEGTRICAAFSCRSEGELDAVELRERLSHNLPTYMLPIRWRRLARMPLGPSGKLDRGALTRMFEESGRDD